jgi:hypothetical protein
VGGGHDGGLAGTTPRRILNMPKQKTTSIVQEQAKTKPKIEDIIPEYLDGKSRQSLMELLEFCRANGIKYPWSATNRWKLSLKGKTIGMIYIGKEPCQPLESFAKNVWHTTVYLDMEVAEKENLTKVIHRNVRPCARGPKTCRTFDTVTIFGKEFTGACKYAAGRFANPDAETLDCIKKLLEHRIRISSDSR